MEFSLKLENIDGVLKRVNGDAIRRGGRAMLDYASLLGTTIAKEKAPVRSNVLRGSIQRSTLTDTKSIIETRVKYARFQESGTGIYGEGRGLITPKRAKFLVFKNKAGKTIFAKAVRGTKPRWFMRGAKEYLESNMNKVLSVGATEIKRLVGL